jgi:hypothetical protein
MQTSPSVTASSQTAVVGSCRATPRASSYVRLRAVAHSAVPVGAAACFQDTQRGQNAPGLARFTSMTECPWLPLRSN